MGFFTWLVPGESKREQAAADRNNEQAMAAAPTTDFKRNPPVARIVRVKTDMNGQRMDIYGFIKNESQLPLTLWRFRLGGIDRNLAGSNLSVGENQQTLLYSGPAFTSQPNGNAELVYRTPTGDNFLAYHNVRGRQQSPVFIVTDLNLDLPIRDVQ